MLAPEHLPPPPVPQPQPRALSCIPPHVRPWALPPVLRRANTRTRTSAFVFLRPRASTLEPVRACAFEHTALPVRWTVPGLAVGLGGHSCTARRHGDARGEQWTCSFPAPICVQNLHMSVGTRRVVQYLDRGIAPVTAFNFCRACRACAAMIVSCVATLAAVGLGCWALSSVLPHDSNSSHRT